ncbi:hypothetical protein MHYP_G00232840 [Metynnis hypsauchen]
MRVTWAFFNIRGPRAEFISPSHVQSLRETAQVLSGLHRWQDAFAVLAQEDQKFPQPRTILSSRSIRKNRRVTVPQLLVSKGMKFYTELETFLLDWPCAEK